MPAHPPSTLPVVAILHRVGAAVHPLPLPGPAGLLEVGRWGPLPCWTSTHDDTATIRIARRLARLGELGLLITAGTDGRHLLCVTLAPLRVSVVARDHHAALELSRLARTAPAPTLLAAAMSCAAALDVDAAGRRAFRALRHGIEQAVESLPGTLSPYARHAWVLLQVTRLLFLRFVESEGWLAGRPGFLAEEFDRCMAQGRNPEQPMLAPLFFGTLNKPMHLRSKRAAALGAIPFLNGGLFEPHPIERHRNWSLPVAAWQQLLPLLIESFEVTLDKGDVGDRVSPELLGRVFEGMMEPKERKAAGTYYTPSGLVPAVVRATLCSHLALRLGRTEDRIDRDLDDRDAELDTTLLSLRILDPAVGSGAFLVGALSLICAGPHGTASRVRHVIHRRLFGVDRNPAAVRLTELRLWLELLRAMRGRPPARVTPLPNLDTTIRAGDALDDPFAGLRVPPAMARRLALARRGVATGHGAERRAAVTRLRRAERSAARAGLQVRAVQLRETIADLVDQARATDLFGVRGTLRAGVQDRIVVLRRELRQVTRKRMQLRHDGAAAGFGIESAFAGVLARGGFDLVIGNPPWVRGERLAPRERARLTARFRWWRGSGTGWRHSPDLSIAFVERSCELLAPRGTFGLLLPGKITTTGYAMRCRAALAEHATVHVVADLANDPRASFDATIYPMAVVVSRQRADEQHHVSLDLSREHSVPQRKWRGAGTWSLAGSDISELRERMARFPPLAATASAALGVKTGANKAFLDPPETLHRWTRPAIRGRDVRPLVAIGSARLLWPADDRGAPWRHLPLPVREHLRAHRSQLERRSDLVDGVWWRLFRVFTATERWRVTWSDLAPTLRAAPLRAQFPVPLNSCYVIALPTEAAMLACAAWLNARTIRLLAHSTAEPAANGYARFGARAVGAIPLPPGALHDPTLAELGRSTWSAEVASAIDVRVAHWLQLTDDDLELIDAVDTTDR